MHGHPKAPVNYQPEELPIYASLPPTPRPNVPEPEPATLLPDDFTPDEKTFAWALAIGFDADAERRIRSMFRDYARAHGLMQHDWSMSYRRYLRHIAKTIAIASVPLSVEWKERD